MVWGGGVKRNSCRETVFFTPRRRFWLWCAAQLAESCLLQNRETWCRWEVGLRHIFLRRSQLSRTRWGRRRRWGAGDYSVKLWICDLRRYWDNFWKRTKSLNPSQLISKHFKIKFQNCIAMFNERAQCTNMMSDTMSSPDFFTILSLMNFIFKLVWNSMIVWWLMVNSQS